MNTPTKVYHYTAVVRWKPIAGSGVLRATSVAIDPGERPALWFSARKTYEPTAYKNIREPSGNVRPGTYQDLFKYGGGALRFGVPPDGLVSWSQHRRDGGISAKVAKGLERVAKRIGAEPRDWYVSYEPVPIANCTIEWQPEPHGPWLPFEPQAER